MEPALECGCYSQWLSIRGNWFSLSSRYQLHIVSWLGWNFVSTCPFQAWGLAVLNLCRHSLQAHISTGHVVFRIDYFLGCHPSSLALTTLSASPSTEIPEPWGEGVGDDIPIRTQYLEVSFCTSSSLSANTKLHGLLWWWEFVSFCFVLTLFLSYWVFLSDLILIFETERENKKLGGGEDLRKVRRGKSMLKNFYLRNNVCKIS